MTNIESLVERLERNQERIEESVQDHPQHRTPGWLEWLLSDSTQGRLKGLPDPVKCTIAQTFRKVMSTALPFTTQCVVVMIDGRIKTLWLKVYGSIEGIYAAIFEATCSRFLRTA